MTDADLTRARTQVVAEWLRAVGTPYRWGGKLRGVGLDCSGLIEVGWRAGGVWPFLQDASSDMLWKTCRQIEWDQRLPGDAICYGDNGKAHHVVGIATLPTRDSQGVIIGANHGGQPWPNESNEDYIARMTAKGAEVVTAAESYWITKRLGVIRAPRLVGV